MPDRSHVVASIYRGGDDAPQNPSSMLPRWTEYALYRIPLLQLLCWLACCFASLDAASAQSSFRPRDPDSTATRQDKASKQIIVSLEISPDPKGTVGSMQKWMAALHRVGADRVTTGTAGEASIDEKESSRAISVRVKGFIERGKLVLPGGKFSLSQVNQVKALMDDFRKNGAEVALSEKKAFGLTAKQLVWLHNQLTVPVKIETKGKPLEEVVATLTRPITANSKINFAKDSMANRTINASNVVSEELKGLSTGTALAAILRPFGLVMEPVHIRANEIELHFKDSRRSREHWPVGWPLRDPPFRVEPKMFQSMPINIRNVALDKVLAVVQQKADVPFLYDQNTMAREGIVLAENKVSLQEKKSSLAVVTTRLLVQTEPRRMSHEIRMDETGKGFVWISVRQAKLNRQPNR